MVLYRIVLDLLSELLGGAFGLSLGKCMVGPYKYCNCGLDVRISMGFC